MNDQITEQENVYEIYKWNLHKLDKRIAKLANKAEKFGLPAPTYEVLGEGIRHVPQPPLDPKKVPVLYVRVEGQAPKLDGGWSFVGIIDHQTYHDQLGYLITQAPSTADLEIPENYYHDEPTCDHCNTIRPRNQTFLLIDEDGNWLRVGRDCMKDYLGHKSPQAYARWLYGVNSLTSGLDENHASGDNPYVEAQVYLEIVSAVIRNFGWVSKTRSREEGITPTAWAAQDGMNDPSLLKDAGISVTDQDVETANNALEWARGPLVDLAENGNDYFYNLAIVCDQEFVHRRQLGLLASLIPTWEREIVTKAREDEARATSEHVGEIKERLDLTLTCDKTVIIDGYMPDTLASINIMSDENGNVFVWKSSTILDEGHTYRIIGTVKAHDEYNGVAQTHLTRCRVMCPTCNRLFKYYITTGGGDFCPKCNPQLETVYDVDWIENPEYYSKS
jgi:hypothetical protein